MQNPGMTTETFSDNQSLLQQKEMHMDMNFKKDLQALTSEIEEGWKHVEKKKGKRKNNEETNQVKQQLNKMKEKKSIWTLTVANMRTTTCSITLMYRR